MSGRINHTLLSAWVKLEVGMAALLLALQVLLIGKPGTRKKVLKGEVSLEWVLVGGFMVVIIAAAMVAFVKPNFDTAIKNIMNLISNDTSAGAGTP